MGLTDKLKLKIELPLLLVDAPAHLAHVFAGYQLQTSIDNAEQVVCFVQQSNDIAAKAPGIIKQLKAEGLLWFAYPKKSGSIPTDLGRDTGWQPIFSLGYEPVASAAIDSDWTALRFKKKEEIGGYIRGIPMEERQVEGIDFKNRTVQLPADAAAAISQYEGMQAYFDQLAFSHKKEHVIAITEAKKPETRASRIEKMIQILHTKMQAKKI